MCTKLKKLTQLDYGLWLLTPYSAVPQNVSTGVLVLSNTSPIILCQGNVTYVRQEFSPTDAARLCSLNQCQACPNDLPKSPNPEA